MSAKAAVDLQEARYMMAAYVGDARTVSLDGPLCHTPREAVIAPRDRGAHEWRPVAVDSAGMEREWTHAELMASIA